MSQLSHRFFLGAFGDPGHAFPMVALGKELREQGHTVAVQTWKRWRNAVEAEGLDFFPAPEYQVFPTQEKSLQPYKAAYQATLDTKPVLDDFKPDVVVNDILTLAPALAAELHNIPQATLIPHLFPATPANAPPFSIGARWSKNQIGKAGWQFVNQLTKQGFKKGSMQLNELRENVGLAPVHAVHGGLSRSCCLVATIPQLEYARHWPAHCHVIGPLFWQPEHETLSLPPMNDKPLVLIAPSTSQDKKQRLLKTALTALANEPVTVIAPHQNSGLAGFKIPQNAYLLDWISYKEVMPYCSLTICHGGHGTVAYALTSGCPLLIVPAAGDMHETAARVSSMELGAHLPEKFLHTKTVRASVRYLLSNEKFRHNADRCQQWWSKKQHCVQLRRQQILETLT